MSNDSAKFGGRRLAFGAAAALICSLCVPGVRAGVTGTPQWGSLEGATYTLYLDFAGFDYTGNWVNETFTPGPTTAFNKRTDTFSESDKRLITFVWARVAKISFRDSTSM